MTVRHGAITGQITLNVGDPRANNWVGDPPQPKHEFGLTVPEYKLPPGVAPVNASLDAKLDRVIALLEDIQRRLG